MVSKGHSIFIPSDGAAKKNLRKQGEIIDVCGVDLTKKEIKTTVRIYESGTKIMVAAILAIKTPDVKGQLYKVKDTKEFEKEILKAAKRIEDLEQK